ncbi:MAG: A24 family peptidase [Clostridia bacterium]|nr:A24 family peptidase [Clostridia bacterium]
MTIVIIKIATSILIGFFAGPAAVWVFNHMPAKWLCDYGESPETRERLVGRPGTLVPQQDEAATRRIRENPWRWVYAVGFICLCLRLSLADILDGFVDVQNQTGWAEGGFGSITIDAGASMQLAAAGLIACWILLIIALADLKYMIIPDQFVLLLAVSAVGFTPYFRHINEITRTGQGPAGTEHYWPVETLGAFGEPLIGCAIGAGFMLLCALAGRLIFRQQAFGFGDVKLCGAMGLVLGVNGIVASMAAAIIISGFVAAAGLVAGKYRAGQQKPLGPYLCGAAMAYIIVVMPLM